MKKSFSFLLVATVFTGATPTLASTFSELVKNTKEAESILLRREPAPSDEDGLTLEEKYPEAATRIREKMPAAFAAMALTLEPKDKEHPPTEACEPLILSRLQKEMQALGLPSEPEAVRYGLLILREKNLIDDVALLPLLSAHSAWQAIGYDEKEWVKKDSKGRTAVLLCPTDQELETAASVRSENGRKMKRRHIKARIEKMAKEEREIPKAEGEKNDKIPPKLELRFLPVQIQWLKALNESKFDKETPFSLPEVLKQVAAAKNSSERASPSDTPTKIMSKKVKKTGGLSNRLALYAKYNSLQISILSDTFKKFTERMAAVSVEVRIKYGEGQEDEVYKLSPQEQYRMAAKMLHKEAEELKLSSLFAGKNPSFDEIIIASVETGYVHAKELDVALAVDDLWNPAVPGWQKAWNITKKYGSTLLIFIPPPGNLWASLAVALIETVVQKTTAKPLASDARGISIF